MSEAYYRVRHEEGLGMGDVKMLAMIGAFLGWKLVLLTLLLASFLGSIVGVGDPDRQEGVAQVRAAVRHVSRRGGAGRGGRRRPADRLVSGLLPAMTPQALAFLGLTAIVAVAGGGVGVCGPADLFRRSQSGAPRRGAPNRRCWPRRSRKRSPS